MERTSQEIAVKLLARIGKELEEKESRIVYEKGDYWVWKSEAHKGYDVLRTGITHSVRVGIIGYEGLEGIERAKKEIDRRLAA